jgi:hypothetical protein
MQVNIISTDTDMSVDRISSAAKRILLNILAPVAFFINEAYVMVIIINIPQIPAYGSYPPVEPLHLPTLATPQNILLRPASITPPFAEAT